MEIYSLYYSQCVGSVMYSSIRSRFLLSHPLHSRGGRWHAVGDVAVWLHRIFAIAREVVLSSLQSTCQIAQERVELAPAVVPLATVGVAGVQGDGALVQKRVDVGRSRVVASIVVSHGGIGEIGRAGGLERLRSLDDLEDKTSTEWLHVRDNHLLVGRRARGREVLRELGEAECGDDRGDISVVTEVEI